MHFDGYRARIQFFAENWSHVNLYIFVPFVYLVCFKFLDCLNFIFVRENFFYQKSTIGQQYRPLRRTMTRIVSKTNRKVSAVFQKQ